MTICIGATCDNERSVVVAIDRMLTNSALSIEFEHPGKKLTQLSEACMALTAGNAVAHTELLRMVQDRLRDRKTPTVGAIAEVVKGAYQDVRHADIVDRILKPRGFAGFGDYYKAQSVLNPEVVASIQYLIDTYDCELEIIVAGADMVGGHVYGVWNPGISSCFDSIGYLAIGSGMSHATDALIVRTCHGMLTKEQVLYIVYEAKKRAERAPGVGKTATDMAVVSVEGIVELSDKQVEALELLRIEKPIPDIDVDRVRTILLSESPKGELHGS